jgi:hypothetical protein
MSWLPHAPSGMPGKPGLTHARTAGRSDCTVRLYRARNCLSPQNLIGEPANGCECPSMAREGRTRPVTHHSSPHAHHSGAARPQVGRRQRPGAERLCGGAQPAGGHAARREALRADDVGGRRAAGAVPVLHPEPVRCAVRPARAPRRLRPRVSPLVCGVASSNGRPGGASQDGLHRVHRQVGSRAGRSGSGLKLRQARQRFWCSRTASAYCPPCSRAARAGVLKWKAEAERLVREPGLPDTIMRPSCLTSP